MNYQALFTTYNFLTWAGLTPFLTEVPQENKEELNEIIMEDQMMARMAVQVAMDASYMAATSVATAITRRRPSWLLA